MSEKRPHPDHDDRGTLDWHTRFAPALAQAREEGKHLFIELGRDLCSQCRALVQSVIPRPDVAPLLQEFYVSLAADADDFEDEVGALASQVDGMMLPFLVFADDAGNFLGGLAGEVTPEQLIEKLLEHKPAD